MDLTFNDIFELVIQNFQRQESCFLLRNWMQMITGKSKMNIKKHEGFGGRTIIRTKISISKEILKIY
jgi:hypothetical protein